MPIEVGCRGFVAHSLHRALSVLGITGGARSRAIKNTTRAAEKASRWLWIRRDECHLNTAAVGSPGVGSMMLKDLKLPMTPGFIIEDLFRCIRR